MEGAVGTCAICLESLNASSTVRLDCAHIFHQKCIFRSVSLRNACPLCNRILYISSNHVEPEPSDFWHCCWICIKILAFVAAIIVVILMFAKVI